MRKNITVNDEMADLIERVADMLQMSQSDLVRQAIREFMERRGHV